MPKIAANLSMMFTEHDFLDRFEAAANAAFDAVEFLLPYDYPAAEIKSRLHSHGLQQALFNLPSGDWAAGERGFAALPGRQADFAAAVDKGLDYADVLGNQLVHAMSGIPGPDADLQECHQVAIENLRMAAEKAAARGKTIIIEPLNTRDNPGYFLTSQAQARSLIEAVGHDNLGLQFDLYNCQIMEGDLAQNLHDYFDLIRHIQIAGVPGRHEPTNGEINHRFLFELMDRLGYAGWVGCEYRPAGATVDGLAWIKEYLS